MITPPESHKECAAEYREGYRRGWNGHNTEVPAHLFTDRTPLWSERKKAWEAGVRKGSKDRQRELERRENERNCGAASMNHAKVVSAKRQAGALALRLMQAAERRLTEGRASMHWSHKRYGGLSSAWKNDYRYTKWAAEELRAARILLYDKLPGYAK